MRILYALLALASLGFPATAKELVITFGGDVNFNRSGQVPKPEGVTRHGETYKWDELTAGVSHLLNGDLNFINLETVLTDKVQLTPAKKRYVFRSHPDSLKHLVNLGVNLVSLANNHAYDYRYEGFSETLENVKGLKLEHAGIGLKERIFRPTVFAYQDIVVAFNAMTFLEVPYPAKNDQVGVLDANNMDHWDKVIRAFAKSKADIKILSLHKGLERRIDPEQGIRARLRKAVKDGDLDLVLAHHPHVVRGVERVGDNSLIFYGLGNFLMIGARNMGPLEDGKDFGLFGKVILKRDEERQWHLSAVQVTPLTDMHLIPKAMGHKAASKRIKHLNKLNRKTSGKAGVEFDIKSDATGLACFGERKYVLCQEKTPKIPKAKPVSPEPLQQACRRGADVFEPVTAKNADVRETGFCFGSFIGRLGL